MSLKMHGKIKWFKKNKGYGYIIGSDDDTYFFELIDCVNQEETFLPDDEVLFIPKIGELNVATKVEKIDEGETNE